MRRILLALTFFVSNLAYAQGVSTGCEVPGQNERLENPRSQLVLLTRTCLGSPEDRVALVQDMADILKGPAVVGTTARLRQAVDLLLNHASGAKTTDPEAWSAVTGELVRAKSVLNSLKGDEAGTIWLTTVEKALSAVWKMPAAGVPILLEGRTFDLLQPPPGCQAKQPCPAFAARADLLRVINMVSNLQAMALRPSLQSAYEDASLQLKRWQAYRQDGHPLYFYEVALNSALMKTDLLGRPCKDQDWDGVRRGFCEVPTRQLILLHPEGALRFSRSATKSSELKPALVIEALGFYTWNWEAESGDKGAVPTQRWGASLAATYTSTDSTGKESRWGYGPVFHWGDYSLAVTKASGGRWSFVVNVPLAGAYFGRRQEAIDGLAKLK